MTYLHAPDFNKDMLSICGKKYKILRKSREKTHLGNIKSVPVSSRNLFNSH